MIAALSARWSVLPAHIPQLLRETAVGEVSEVGMCCIVAFTSSALLSAVKCIAIKWSSVICLWQVCVGYSFVLQVFRIEFQWEVLLHPSRDCSGSKLAPVPWVFLLFKVATVCWVYQPFSSHRGPPMINVIFSWIIDKYLVITLANYFNSSGWVPSQPYGLECTQFVGKA